MRMRRERGLCDCGRRFCAYLQKKFRQIWCCCIKKGNKVSTLSQPRVIHVDQWDPHSKENNVIKTSKYTLLTFIPLNLSEQFRRVVNFYFLFVTIIAIVIDSPVSPMTSIGPLTFMVLVTALKQGYEDMCRHNADDLNNNKSVQTIVNGEIKEMKNMNIKPGMLVHVPRGGDVPADLVLLCSAGQGKCFVTTANLDGETSLKTLKVPPSLNGYKSVPRSVKIEVPPPQADLYTFYGRLSMTGKQSYALGPDNLMLRGSRVKNTEWAIGCAVYTGVETKLALNSKFTSNKFSSAEKAVNTYMLFFVIVLVVVMTGSTVVKVLIDNAHPERQSYLGEISLAPKYIINDFFSFLLLFYYIVPMSLYVTIETYKFFGAMFIGWDADLYNERPAVANTSDLNEELGQVQVLFSDKTGTLTKNLMIFKACSIRGEIYMERDNQFYTLDNELADTDQADFRFFFNVLALCHCVQTTPDELKRTTTSLSMRQRDSENFVNFLKKTFSFGQPKRVSSLVDDGFGESVDEMPHYQASSPDEKALVEAASKAGFAFLGEESNDMIVRTGNYAKRFERLQVIEFTAERKRMSVIVRDINGVIWLYCKGAETSVFPLCENLDMVDEINKNIDEFAKLGLRTLAIAYRRIDSAEYQKIEDSIKAVHDVKLENLSNLFKVFEQKLTLIGATAVEDCLQDGVADTLAALKRAGINTWVLTGDKVETAVNVSQSCEHVSKYDRKMYMIGIDDVILLEDSLRKYELKVWNASIRNSALILDGITIGCILNSNLTQRFVQLTLMCNAVLCCRLSPLQKAEIVKLVKHSPQKPITAAIGDGANDISMIQEAHVGFGIFGNEGHQAARSADYAFTDFSMLRKMLLVLGHWYYERMATLIHYFFYKNLVLTLAMFYFQFHTGFSTQSIYDSMFLTFYNMVFTCIPCLWLSLTDQRWPPDQLMDNPALYKTISRNRLMRWALLFVWMGVAIYHTTVIYLFTTLAFKHDVINTDGKNSDFWSFGATLYHLSIIVVNLKLWIQARYQTFYFVLSIILSIAANIIFSALYSYFYWPLDGDVLGTYLRLLSSSGFWALNVLVIVTNLCADFILRLYFDNRYRYSKSLFGYTKVKQNMRDKIATIFGKKSKGIFISENSERRRSDSNDSTVRSRL